VPKVQPNPANATQIESAEDLPPLKLTLEETIPWTRWLIAGLITLAVLLLLAWAINAGNPKITASTLANAPTMIAPTVTPMPGVYTATLEIHPPEPVTPNGTIAMSGTLKYGDAPVEGARLHLSVPERGGRVRDIEAGLTGANGIATAETNIGRPLAGVPVRVVASFYVDDELVVRAFNSFTPVP
jgi:hypothetical protein